MAEQNLSTSSKQKSNLSKIVDLPKIVGPIIGNEMEVYNTNKEEAYYCAAIAAAVDWAAALTKNVRGFRNPFSPTIICIGITEEDLSVCKNFDVLQNYKVLYNPDNNNHIKDGAKGKNILIIHAATFAQMYHNGTLKLDDYKQFICIEKSILLPQDKNICVITIDGEVPYLIPNKEIK